MRLRTTAIVTSLALLTAVGLAKARIGVDGAKVGRDDKPFRVLVLDGSPVHNVGQLRMHTGNWGGVGSWPGTGLPFSEAPSAEWPAGSGVEYLYAGGLWVGAIANGVPKVSTAVFELEFRPTPDPIDIVYRSAEGARRGNRAPSPHADDDNDGTIDEDPLDGHDNDGDGAVDEDFAAISDQMFSRWYTDDQPVAVQIYPNHRPLNVMVRENSYQWSDDDFDDFVGFDYEITNIGSSVLQDVFVGWFLDADVGNRLTPNYWEDDATGYRRVPVRCTEHGPVSLDFAYTYDADGDGGTATAHFGLVVLDHPTDPQGVFAPERVGASTYARFSVGGFEEGGDPISDFERYEVMSSQKVDRDESVPRDYRMLVSVGPFRELRPGETMTVSMALVATPGDGSMENVANAAVAYKGRWFDADSDPITGVDRRETPVPGPVEVIIDACRPGYDQPIFWGRRDPIWINRDCEQEATYGNVCGYLDADSLLFRTGVAGREHQAHWWLPNQEPPLEALAAEVKITPRTVNLSSQGDPLDAHVTLPDGYSVADVDESSLRMNATIPGRILTVVDDRIFKARFSRKALQASVGVGELEVTVSGLVDGHTFEGVDHIRTIQGGGPTRSGEEAPSSAGLSHSPNPFNPSARIVFALPQRGDVVLEIFSADGRRVRRLASGPFPAGRHGVVWRGDDDRGTEMPSGIYFCRLRAGGETLTRKMVMIK